MTQLSNPRFIMLGGFLGAGKTTTVARLARHYQQQGKRVAIVTNDQATDLVDTQSLRAQGFEVGEVAGSCFCCNFNELTATVERLGVQERPDVVLAEPVGSCTDLVATVIRPLREIYDQPFDIAPYGVILKPSHGRRILRRETSSRGGFSPQAEYIFRKQIEEADFIILNRIDELTDVETQELLRLVQNAYPGYPILRMSAKSGVGLDALYEYLDQQGNFGQRAMDVDYDVYAEGEADLGWLNAQAKFESTGLVELDGLLMSLIMRLQLAFEDVGAETAHLKCIGMADQHYAVANLISSDTPPVLSLPARARCSSGDLVINARIAIDPERLSEMVQASVQRVALEMGASISIQTLQCFRPGRPVPTHRILG